jgi:hypothetical protein
VIFIFKLFRRKPLIISGITGDFFKNLNRAPRGYRSVFFSNNPELLESAVKKGWEFFLLKDDFMGISKSFLTSSVQSKYIKFLGFLEDYPQFQLFDSFIYVDHKILLTSKTIRTLEKIKDRDKSILIRNGKTLRNSLTDEINVANQYPRYSLNMPATISWIDTVLASQKLQAKVRIMNTGLIYYSNIEAIKPLLDEVLDVINKLQQPECQLIFALLSQKYENLIQRVEFSDVNLEHVLPPGGITWNFNSL